MFITRFPVKIVNDIEGNKQIRYSWHQTKLVEFLPKNLKGSLPTVEEIESEFGKPKRHVKEKQSKSKARQR